MPEENKGTWRDIFKAFKHAISAQKLLVALVVVVWFNILNFAFFGGNMILANIGRSIGDAFAATFSGLNPIEGARAFLRIPGQFVPPFPADWSVAGKVLVGLAFYLLVWIPSSFFIGILARLSAVQIARGENIGLKEATRFAKRKYLSFLLPLVLVFAAFLIVGLIFNFIIGVIGYIPYFGEILVPLIAYPITILVSLAAVMIIVFGLLGAPLMAPAISVEGQDSFDALSRSYHYSVQRLGRYVIYLAVMFFFMAASIWFVDRMIVQKIEYISVQAYQFIPMNRVDLDTRDKEATKDEERIVKGQYERMIAAYRDTWPLQANHMVAVDSGGTEPILKWVTKKELKEIREKMEKESLAEPLVLADMKLTTGESIGGFILTFWLKGLRYLVGAFALSFFVTASTIIYFILRKQIDGAEFDEVYIEGEEEEFEFGEDFGEAAREKPGKESEGTPGE